ncbi:MAG: ATP-grasp domain-containing protein [Candidatus Woesebacteria bacterium]
MTSQLIFDELASRGIAVEVFDLQAGILRYRHNNRWHYIFSSRPESTSAIGAKICDEKNLTTKLAIDLGVLSPATLFYSDVLTAKDFLSKHKIIVVKPLDASHGNGITVNVKTEEGLKNACNVASAASETGQIILQQQVTGDDLRVLVIGGKYVAACQRIPARVFGNGKSTILQLIEHENQTNSLRDYDYKNQLNVIDLGAAKRYLKDQINSIPADGQEVRVVGTANMGTGGEAIDITNTLPSQIIKDAEKLAQALKITACGVDFMYNSKTQEYNFIEANSTPSFGLHENPTHGQAQPVTKRFVEYILS